MNKLRRNSHCILNSALDYMYMESTLCTAFNIDKRVSYLKGCMSKMSAAAIKHNIFHISQISEIFRQPPLDITLPLWCGTDPTKMNYLSFMRPSKYILQFSWFVLHTCAKRTKGSICIVKTCKHQDTFALLSISIHPHKWIMCMYCAICAISIVLSTCISWFLMAIWSIENGH